MLLLLRRSEIQFLALILRQVFVSPDEQTHWEGCRRPQSPLVGGRALVGARPPAPRSPPLPDSRRGKAHSGPRTRPAGPLAGSGGRRVCRVQWSCPGQVYLHGCAPAVGKGVHTHAVSPRVATPHLADSGNGQPHHQRPLRRLHGPRPGQKETLVSMRALLRRPPWQR